MIKHLAICDNEKCGRQEPAIKTLASNGWKEPGGWVRVDKKAFCSIECAMSNLAGRLVNNDKMRSV